MPASKHKPITSSPEGSTPQSSTPIAPDQEEFRQYLRRLAVSAVQVLIEQVMREELEQCDLHGSDRGHPRVQRSGRAVPHSGL
jgi:putative transposase